MESCNKELGLYTHRTAKHRLMILRCCDSIEHDGECQFHVHTDGFNNAMNKEGITKVIFATKKS